MQAHHYLSRLFAACAVAVFLAVAAMGVARPTNVLASQACGDGGPQLCGEETYCVGAFWWEVCETQYLYQEVGTPYFPGNPDVQH